MSASTTVPGAPASLGGASASAVRRGGVGRDDAGSGGSDQGVVGRAGPGRPRSGFARAFADTIGVGLGLFPLGMAFGVLVVQAGLAWWWTPAFSIAIYAGSMEFVALGLVLTLTPLAQIGLATFLVNFRHVFYGLTFPLHRVAGRGGRVRSASGIAARTYSIYALTDEVYALTSVREKADRMTRGHILWLQAFCQAYWVAGGMVGALLGSLIPGRLAGLEFALTALFAVLAIDALRAAPDVLAPVLALVASTIALVVARDQLLMVAMSVYVVALIVRYAVTRARARRGGRSEARVWAGAASQSEAPVRSEASGWSEAHVPSEASGRSEPYGRSEAGRSEASGATGDRPGEAADA